MSISTTDFAPYPQYLTRYTRRGLSSRPQGLDGVSELTRTAYENLVGAVWEADDSGPSLPVHEFDRDAPTGDAYRATWGYDATGRTEQSAAGAVCYTVRMPKGNRPTLTSITARVAGDRWLGDGARLTAVLSDSATPPTWAEVLASSYQSAVLCATDGQTEAPNVRTAVVEDVTIAIGVTCTEYLHLVLRIDDYETHRSAWIEGGAMLLPDSIAVTLAEALVYNREGTILSYGNDYAEYEASGNQADAIGVDDKKTAFYFVHFPQPTAANRDSFDFFKKGDLFICEQVASWGSGSTTFNNGQDITQSKTKYRNDFSQTQSDGFARVGMHSRSNNNYYSGMIVVLNPLTGGTFKSLMFPALTGSDGVWAASMMLDYEMVAYRAPNGLPPFVPVNNTHSMNNKLCASIDPLRFPYRAFFDTKTATQIHFSNSTITSIVSDTLPDADETAALDIEFVDSWPFVGDPQDVDFENDASGTTGSLEAVTEFKFSTPLTITSRESLIIGVWPRRRVASTGTGQNIIVPDDWEIALLK